MENEHFYGLLIAVIFLTGVLLLHHSFDPSLDVEMEKIGRGDLSDGAGYQSIELKVKNNEDHLIRPRFYVIEPTEKGPHRLFMNKTGLLKPGETEKISVKPAKYTYLSAERNKKYIIVLKDLKSSETYSKILENQIRIQNSTIRNIELVSFGGKPPGWTERFTASPTQFKFGKTLEGVSIQRFPAQDSKTEGIGYYLSQRFNLTRQVYIKAEYTGLSKTAAGFRIVDEEKSATSTKEIIEVDFTEMFGESASISRSFNLTETFREQNKEFKANRTVWIQIFYKAEPGKKNRFFIDKVNPHS